MQRRQSFSKNSGAALVDSVIALALLGSAIAGFAAFTQTNLRHKNAKQLAVETETYAQVFARYMNNNFTDLIKQSSSQDIIILNPPSLAGSNSWPKNLALTNLYHQTPCVTIVKNPVTHDLEAILYYVGGTDDVTSKQKLLVNEASIILGNKGGVLSAGSITGNSGWSIPSGSSFLSGANQCGGAIAENSLAVNIDLLTDWNQTIQPNTSITKGQDPGDPTDATLLPGHLLNTNTTKANINFTGNHGVVFDNSDLQNPLKLGIGYGSGSDQATLGVSGSSGLANLVADTIQTYQQGVVGDPCGSQEIGKTIVDMGTKNSELSKYLARNTLVCTRNDMLCRGTCYLPSIKNSIIFKNTNIGIQNTGGNFKCPTAVPFASDPAISSEGSASPIISSIAGYTVTIGYSLNTPGAMIVQVTCSNMPEYVGN